jgi:hypothetical protein
VVGLIALLACAAKVQGVVGVQGPRVALTEPDGTSWHLVYSPEDGELRRLEDCTLEVQGRRLGQRVTVEDWKVLASAQGSTPYVGVLVRRGSNLVLQDRNSGQPVILEGDEQLQDLVGRTVLVSGYVVGPQVVQVMAVSLLD